MFKASQRRRREDVKVTPAADHPEMVQLRDRFVKLDSKWLTRAHLNAVMVAAGLSKANICGYVGHGQTGRLSRSGTQYWRG